MQLVPRSEVESFAWNSFVEAHPDGWWFHTDQWLAYALAYTPGSVDISHAMLADDGNIAGVLPLVLDPTGDFVNGGQMVAYPLGQVSAPEPCTIGVAGRPGQRLQGVDPGFSTYVVDLKQDLAAMWRQLRGSYKPLINKAQRQRAIQTFSGCGDPCDMQTAAVLMNDARRLHETAAGRQTRSDETWRLQANWLALGHAVVSVAYDATRPVGFAYALRWKGWSYYFSGASLEDSVSHALIWNLMVGVRAAGGEHFEVGHAAGDDASEKERGIAFFKAGFGGTQWPVAAVIR